MQQHILYISTIAQMPFSIQFEQSHFRVSVNSQSALVHVKCFTGDFKCLVVMASAC